MASADLTGVRKAAVLLLSLSQDDADPAQISFTADGKALIATEGYDPVYGARPIKRTIQKLILDPLAQKVLSGEYKEGDTVFVDAEDGSIQFWTEEFADKKAKDRKDRGQPVGSLN